MGIVNVRKLHGELVTAGLTIVGVDASGRIDWSAVPTPDQIDLAAQILAAHDPHDYEADVAAAAETQAKVIPEWAGWTIAEFLAWHATNIGTPLTNAPTVTTANLVAVLNGLLPVLRKVAAEQEALGQMVIALRNKTWPGLQRQ